MKPPARHQRENKPVSDFRFPAIEWPAAVTSACVTRLLRSFESALRLAGFAAALGLGGCHATNARSPARPGADRSSYVLDMPATAEDVAGRAPYRLTAATSDSLRLRALEARVTVAAPFAQTELRLTFDPAQQPDVLGLLDIALPASALITRLAFRADAGWREANVTARIDPGRSPEELLHRPPKPDAVFWEVLASEQEPLVG